MEEISAPVEGTVVSPPLFTGFYIHPFGGDRRISESSTVYGAFFKLLDDVYGKDYSKSVRISF